MGTAAAECSEVFPAAPPCLVADAGPDLIGFGSPADDGAEVRPYSMRLRNPSTKAPACGTQARFPYGGVGGYIIQQC